MKSLKEALVHKHMDGRANIVKPGDNLQDYDVVLFGYQHSYDKSYAHTGLGIYNAKTEDIEYSDGTHGPWETVKDDFQYFVHGMIYIKYVLKIWRPKGNPVIEYSGDLWNTEWIAKWLDKNKDYMTVYENKDLMKKFRLK